MTFRVVTSSPRKMAQPLTWRKEPWVFPVFFLSSHFSDCLSPSHVHSRWIPMPEMLFGLFCPRDIQMLLLVLFFTIPVTSMFEKPVDVVSTFFFAKHFLSSFCCFCCEPSHLRVKFESLRVISPVFSSSFFLSKVLIFIMLLSILFFYNHNLK